jgi:Trypsin-like peptidase domain
MQTPQEVRDNVVMITDGSGNFGSGFFIDKKYCLTCHHVIYLMEKIKVLHGNSTYDAEWDKKLSDMSKDIAVLKVENANVKVLECANEITPGLDVAIYGFTAYTIDQLPQGTGVPGTLEDTRGPMSRSAVDPKDIPYKNPWNQKPRVDVEAINIKVESAGPGLSGGPVFERRVGKVVAMFRAAQGMDISKDVSNMGYAIPVDILPTSYYRALKMIFEEVFRGKSGRAQSSDKPNWQQALINQVLDLQRSLEDAQSQIGTNQNVINQYGEAMTKVKDGREAINRLVGVFNKEYS